MKRRMFIKTASGLLLSTALAGAAFPAFGSTDLEQAFGPTTMPDSDDLVVTVIGIGGAGCAAIRRIRGQCIPGVASCLGIDGPGSRWPPDITVQSGIETPLTQGDRAQIGVGLLGTHVLVLVVGMGGATGTAIAPQIAQEASAYGVDMVVSMVIEPFSFEGKRSQIAEAGIAAITPHSTTVCRWSNEEMSHRFDDEVSLASIVDCVQVEIEQAIRHLVSAVAVPGLVGIDIEDVRFVLDHAGKHSRFGIGFASGPGQAASAVRTAWRSLDIEGALPHAGGALVTLRTDVSQLRLSTYREMMQEVRTKLSDDALIIASAHHDDVYPVGGIEVGILLNR